jgi:hypothetical protein
MCPMKNFAQRFAAWRRYRDLANALSGEMRGTQNRS